MQNLLEKYQGYLVNLWIHTILGRDFLFHANS